MIGLGKQLSKEVCLRQRRERDISHIQDGVQ